MHTCICRVSTISKKLQVPCKCSVSQQAKVTELTNVLFLTFDNEFSGVMYTLFGGRQTIFLTVFSAAKI